MPVHVGVIVAESAVVRVAVIVLRSTPKVGVVAEIEVVAEVAASGKSRETRRIIEAWVIAHRTNLGTAL